MELWIRSQDKLDLLKCKSIHIEEIPSSKEVAILCYASGDNYSTIGYYKSKERALEVLDEIHQRLINIQCIEITGADYITNQMRKNGLDIVYEMPKE